MLRAGLVAALVMLIGVGRSAAQPPVLPVLRSAAIQGTWFYEGDRRSPCRVELLPGGGLLLTNQQGRQSYGHLAWGRRVVADDWNGLVGDVRVNIISWHNGTYWTR